MSHWTLSQILETCGDNNLPVIITSRTWLCFGISACVLLKINEGRQKVRNSSLTEFKLSWFFPSCLCLTRCHSVWTKTAQTQTQKDNENTNIIVKKNDGFFFLSFYYDCCYSAKWQTPKGQPQNVLDSIPVTKRLLWPSSFGILGGKVWLWCGGNWNTVLWLVQVYVCNRTAEKGHEKATASQMLELDKWIIRLRFLCVFLIKNLLHQKGNQCRCRKSSIICLNHGDDFTLSGITDEGINSSQLPAC